MIVITVYSVEEWEYLCNTPSALTGAFCPHTKRGTVMFATGRAALAALREWYGPWKTLTGGL